MRILNTGVAVTTGKKLLRNTVGFAALICAASVPGYCATAFLSYTGSWSSLGSPNGITVTCSATCNGTNETFSSFDVPITQLTVSNAATTADNGQWTITGGTEVITLSGSTVTVTVDGTIGTCSGCTGGTPNLGGVSGTGNGVNALESITYTGLSGGIPFDGSLTGTSFDTTGTHDSSGFNLNLGAASSVSDLGTLLSDLGETLTTSSVNSGGANASGGSGGTGAGTYAFDSSGSTTLGVTLTSTSTPEPVSFILFGTGLMAVALIARRRRVSQN